MTLKEPTHHNNDHSNFDRPHEELCDALQIASIGILKADDVSFRRDLIQDETATSEDSAYFVEEWIREIDAATLVRDYSEYFDEQNLKVIIDAFRATNDPAEKDNILEGIEKTIKAGLAKKKSHDPGHDTEKTLELFSDRADILKYLDELYPDTEQQLFSENSEIPYTYVTNRLKNKVIKARNNDAEKDNGAEKDRITRKVTIDTSKIGWIEGNEPIEVDAEYCEYSGQKFWIAEIYDRRNYVQVEFDRVVKQGLADKILNKIKTNKGAELTGLLNRSIKGLRPDRIDKNGGSDDGVKINTGYSAYKIRWQKLKDSPYRAILLLVDRIGKDQDPVFAIAAIWHHSESKDPILAKLQK